MINKTVFTTAIMLLAVVSLAHTHSHAHDHDHDHDHTHDYSEGNIHKQLILYLGDLTGFQAWMESMDSILRPLPLQMQGFISTLFIQVVPIFLIFAVNLILSQKMRDTLVHVLLSFALGGLLGDVFFHTMPHMSEGGGHSHSHSHGDPTHIHSHEAHSGHGHHGHSEEAMLMNLYIVMGIWVFFLIDRLTHEFFGGGCDHHSKASDDQDKQLRFKKFAVISMIGDLVHNFTDGLSIGVSYLVDYKMGLATTLAMFFHEIPHEVGDFAILLQLNYSLWQIVLV